MRMLAFWDCPTGISGDMCLGALVSAGVPLDYLRDQLARLKLPETIELKASTVRKNSIAATKVDVILPHELPAQTSALAAPASHPPVRHLSEIEQIITDAALPQRVTEWSVAIFRRLAIAEGHVHGIAPEQVHFHEVGATDAIVDIVGTCLGLDWLNVDEMHCAPLPTGSGTLRAAHGHLPVPAPAVLALMTMAKTPVYSSGLRGELVTPTGAAIATELAAHFGEPPAMRLQKVGRGAGNKDFEMPNILRLWIGESLEGSLPHASYGVVSHHGAPAHSHDHGHLSAHTATHPRHHDHDDSGHAEHLHSNPEHQAPEILSRAAITLAANTAKADLRLEQNVELLKAEALNADCSPIEADIEPRSGIETVVVLETQVDDLSPQAIGYLYDRLFESGALDVFTQPVMMKKSRLGHLITAIVYPDQADRCEQCLLHETTTLGVRRMSQTRLRLRRKIASVQTPLGTVRMKLAFRPGEQAPFKVHPEYEDCAVLAQRHGLPWRDVHLQAVCCWRSQNGEQ